MVNTNWQRIAASIAEIPFQDNSLCTIEVEGQKICLGQYGGKYYAFAATCPHAGALFSEGYLDALGNVVCPKHRYKFVMGNGYNCSGEGYRLKTFPVEIRDNGVYVCID